MVTASKKTRIDYVADFETTTDPLDVRVWGWGIVAVQTPEYSNVELGHTLDEFIERASKHNANIYFHNLKFDGTYIIDWLLRHGYVYSESKLKLAPGEFKALISSMGGKFYSITVMFKNGKTVEFRDSFKKFNMKLSKVAEAYTLPESKGEIDYEAPRPIGYVMNAEERDYLIKDVCIIAQALKMQVDEGMTKLTTASDCMHEFKQGFGTKRFQRVFPVLPNHMDAEIRQSYRGGFTYANERFTGKIQGSGIVLDVNSLYPSVMYSELLPYGEPTYQLGRVEVTPERPLAIFSVTFEAKLRPGYIPCIQLRGQALFGNAEYIKKTKEPTTLWVTSVEWELWNEHYEITVLSYNGGWTFRGAHNLFETYIDKWMAVKATSKGGRRQIAKDHLNNLYGKFGANPNVTGKIPALENDRVVFHLGSEETRPPVYTAMASFITAYARRLTISAAQVNYDTFAYADTDSLHLLRSDTPRELNVHPTELGAWKFEYRFESALYVRSKFYMEQKSDGTHINRAAGVPEDVSALLRYADVWDGHSITRDWVVARTGDPRKSGKLQPKNFPGGVVLMPTPWTITAPQLKKGWHPSH